MVPVQTTLMRVRLRQQPHILRSPLLNGDPAFFRARERVSYLPTHFYI